MKISSRWQLSVSMMKKFSTIGMWQTLTRLWPSHAHRTYIVAHHHALRTVTLAEDIRNVAGLTHSSTRGTADRVIVTPYEAILALGVSTVLVRAIPGTTAAGTTGQNGNGNDDRKLESSRQVLPAAAVGTMLVLAQLTALLKYVRTYVGKVNSENGISYRVVVQNHHCSYYYCKVISMII